MWTRLHIEISRIALFVSTSIAILLLTKRKGSEEPIGGSLRILHLPIPLTRSGEVKIQD
jgi:hypothetical protein